MSWYQWRASSSVPSIASVVSSRSCARGIVRHRYERVPRRLADPWCEAVVEASAVLLNNLKANSESLGRQGWWESVCPPTGLRELLLLYGGVAAALHQGDAGE